MRKWLIAGVSLLVIVAVPIAVLAASGGSGSAKVNEERFLWTTAPDSNGSTTFIGIPGLHANNLCAAGGAAVTLSVQYSGPMAIQVVDSNVGGSFVMHPGPVTLDNSGSTETASFTFVMGPPALGAPHFNTFTAQFKSTTGAAVDFQRGTLNVVYQDAGSAC